MYDETSRNEIVNELTKKLEEYIKDELSDSLYYEILSRTSPNDKQRNILIEMSKEEKQHAITFIGIISRLSGKEYVLPNIEAPKVPEYRTALIHRIIDEADDFRKYGIDYMLAPSNALNNAYFAIMLGENVHAHKLNALLNGLE